MKLMDENEKQIINILKDSTETTQANIYKITQIPKATLSDIMRKLEERNLIEREGLCIGCHQSYGTPAWESIVKKYGRALTAEQHNRILSEALQSLMDRSRGNSSH